MKLHLPKTLLMAVVTACVLGTQAYAAWGWGNSFTYSGATFFVERSSTEDAPETIDFTGKSDSRINLVNDGATKNDLVANASINSDVTLAVCNNPWPDNETFNTVVLKELNVKNNGSIDLEVLDGLTVNIETVKGSLSSVINTGTLTIGTDETSSTKLAGTITNTGTLTINGSIEISSLDGFSLKPGTGGSFSWSDTENQQGYKIYSGATYMLSTGGVTYTDATTVTYKGETLAIASEDGTATFTSDSESTGTVYFIKDTTAITYDGSTGETAAATGFSMGAGTTLNLTAAVGADGIEITGAGATIGLTGTNLNHNSQVTMREGASVAYNLDNATLDLSLITGETNITSLDLKNNSEAQLHGIGATLGKEGKLVNINLSGNSALSFKNGSSGSVWANINIDGSARMLGNVSGDHSVVHGTIKGNGSLTFGRSDATWSNLWEIDALISDGETGALSITYDATDGAEGPSRLVLSNANTYSGGTTLKNGVLIVTNSSALGTGKVTIDGGTLKLAGDQKKGGAAVPASDLTISAMDYKSGSVNIGEKKLTVTGTLKAEAAMTIEGSGDTELGSLDLTAGTTLSTSGSLTIGELILDLDNYTDYTRTYDLVSVTGEGKNVTLGTTYTGTVDGYTYTVNGSGTSSLTLSFEEIVAPSTSLTTTVLDASLDGSMLTLKVDGDITSAEMIANITGFGEGVLEKILGLTKDVKDGMVGITLVDGDATLDDTIVGNGISNVGFYGAYYGEGNGQYFVQYIPEPATATLSLLALAGIAARRRRK